MIEIKQIDGELTMGKLVEYEMQRPVIYVLFSRQDVEEIVQKFFVPSELGELLMVVDFESSMEIRERFRGDLNEHSMIAIAIHALVSGASNVADYPSAIADARDWRRRQLAAERELYGSRYLKEELKAT